MYKVYKIYPEACYRGLSLVAAENAEEANLFIDSYKEIDKENYGDSWGYCSVEEDDIIEGLFAQNKGIIYFGISYSGYC